MAHFMPSSRFNLALLAVGLTTALVGCGGGGSSAAPTPSVPATPASAPVPDLHALVDQVMASTLSSTGATAATVTVMKGSQVLHDQGYGHLDAAASRPVPANALMVTASIVKPVTAAAIQRLASQGKLSLSDHVFCTGSNAPCWLPQALLSGSTDVRVAAITVQHLIAHQGGWDIGRHGNLDFDKQEAVVQQVFKLSSPPTRDDDIRYWLAQPLDFAPGSRTAYSNFGYLLLGRIVELASGMGYLDYVQSQLLEPLGVAKGDFAGAASLLADRSPREPNYLTGYQGPSLFVPGTTVIVTNGAINAPNWVAATTAITTSKAMASFAANYLIDTDGSGVDQGSNGIPLNGKTHTSYHFGNYPGTSAIVRQLSSGLSYAVLMNKSDESGGPGYQPELMRRLDAAMAAAGL